MRRHIILESGRTGSNYLSNTINLHPEIVNFGEVLGDWTVPYKVYERVGRPWLSSVDYVEMIFSSRSFYYAAMSYSVVDRIARKKRVRFKRRRRVKTIGFKESLINLRVREVDAWLAHHTDIAIIHLTRRNLLRRYLSWQAMDQSGVVKTEGATKHDKLRVDVDHLRRNLDVLQGEADDEESALTGLPGHRQLRLFYEDYFASPETIAETNRRVFEFLEVAPIEDRSKHRKILPESLEDVVENMGEVRSALRDSPHARFLDP